MFCLWPLRFAVKQHDLVSVKVSEDPFGCDTVSSY